MIEQLRLIYPYFDNPKMLAMQVENWNRYRGEFAQRVRFIIVDDCSKIPAAPIMEPCSVPFTIYRVQERWPWNMHQCRNIGAKEACTAAENCWLFLSDIDIMLTPEAAITMMERQLDPYKHYTFERTFAPDFRLRKVHINTFLVKHAMFWAVNGYDLDFAPIGGGGYGGDNQFLRQLRVLAPEQHLEDVVLFGYGRSHRDGRPVVDDADTSSLDRNEWAQKYRIVLARKRASGDMRSLNPIRVPYKKVSENA